MQAHLRLLIVYVSDMGGSVAFYRDRLGLPLRFESEVWSEFDAGGITLALHISDTHGSVPAPLATGQVELNLEVANLDEAHESLKAQGVAINDPILLEDIGTRIMTLRDPDGLAITLMETVA